MEPPPLVDVDLISLTPPMRANILSNLPVTSASTTRAAASGIENDTVRLGSVRDGMSLTARRGISAHPNMARATKTTIMEKARVFISLYATYGCGQNQRA